MQLLESKALPPEDAVVASALSIADKVAYTVLDPNKMQVTVDDAEAKKAWEKTKNDYLTPRTYQLAIHWTDTKDINVTQKEIENFYDKNSFNYMSADGKQFPLEKVRALVTQDLKIKKGKKQALLDYIAVKKGKLKTGPSEKLAKNDPILSTALWNEIAQNNAGTLLKPKPVGARYATVKIDGVIEPEPMSFEQAKAHVIQQLTQSKRLAALEKKSEETLNEIEQAKLTTSDYVSLSKNTPLPPLSQAESLQFLQKLFTSSGKKGIIRLSNRVVVYKIIDQKMGMADANLTASVKNETNQIKQRVFENALFQKLNSQFPVKAYAKGL
jgi:peptidyl-prolyl cis-trans isomerase D